MKADADRYEQAQASVPYSGSYSDSGLLPSEVCSEPPKAATSEPPVLTYPVTGKGGTEWHLTPSKLREYEQTYPTLDILAALRAARQWCVDNPTKRKTSRGMPAFCSRWLESAVHPLRREARPRGQRRGAGRDRQFQRPVTPRGLP